MGVWRRGTRSGMVALAFLVAATACEVVPPAQDAGPTTGVERRVGPASPVPGPTTTTAPIGGLTVAAAVALDDGPRLSESPAAERLVIVSDAPTAATAPTVPTDPPPPPSTTAPPGAAPVTTTIPPPATTTTTAAPAPAPTTTVPAPTTTVAPATVASGSCWAPPEGWRGYTVADVPIGGGSVSLDADRDYVLRMPPQAVTGTVRVAGGRNVVLIGGEIIIDADGPKAARMGIKWAGQTGRIHMEGVWIHGRRLTEGIQFNAPDAQAVVQQVRIGEMWGGDNTALGLNHADYIQIWGGLGHGAAWSLRVCGFTAGPSHYNGFMLKDDSGGTTGPIEIRRTNLTLVDGTTTPDAETGGGWTGLFATNVASVRYDPGTVWLDVNDARKGGSLSANVFPAGAADRSDGLGTYTQWSQGWIDGRVYAGPPPGGDYVPAGSVGIGYTVG